MVVHTGAPMSAAAVPSATVVVPTRNRRDRLDRMLAAVLEQEGDFEVVVVLDGCDDGSEDVVARHAGGTRPVRSVATTGVGLVDARREGARAARGEVVVFLDDDVLPEPGLVAGHARRHAAERRLVVVGHMPVWPPHDGRTGRPTAYVYSRAYADRVADYERDPGGVLRGFWAGNFSIRRDDFLAVSARTTPGVIYHEDLELGLNCLEEGLRGVFDASLVGRHQYERPLAAFRRDACNSGRGLWLIHQAHEDVVGPLSLDGLQAGLPWPARKLVALTRRPRLRGLVEALLVATVHSAGAVRMFKLEVRATELLRRVAQQEGVLAAMESA
jgi:glycosyltransferase involved in cell wall biosynthesis